MSVDDTTNRGWGLAVANHRMQFVLAALLAVSFQLMSSNAHAGQFVAFYYDAQGRLLQVEDVPDNAIQSQKRILTDLHDSLMVVPMLTNKSVPLVSGQNLSMSKFATLAVYYEVLGANQGAGGRGVKALPTKVEYVGSVKDRTLLKCLKRDPNEDCRLPKRCHCMFGSCCCY